MSWYLESYLRTSSLQGPDKPAEENQCNGYNTPISIAKSMLALGLTGEEPKDLVWSFLHQSISPLYNSLLEDIIAARKKSIYEDRGGSSSIDNIMRPLITNVPISIKGSPLTEANILMLQSYTPPAGYNLLLTGLALSILNRAYILSHSLISNNKSVELTLVRDEDIGRLYR